MKISYAITVCNEIEEIKRLIPFLLEHKREEDEIVVQQDITNLDENIYSYLFNHDVENNIKFRTNHLNDDFSKFKNHLNTHCSGDYIFQIDADEIPNEHLINSLPLMLEDNPGVDLIYVPRVNTVEGLTDEHIQKWRWRINDKKWVNWPDYQSRIYRNSDLMKWVKPVHEVIIGHKQFSHLPQEEEFCIYHPKEIERQEKQNKFYDAL
jgi:glycosyltransferase involved in cell wall biosynthesis